MSAEEKNICSKSPYSGNSPNKDMVPLEEDADSSSDEETHDLMDTNNYRKTIQAHRAYLSWTYPNDLMKARGMCRLLLPHTYTIIMEENQFILLYPADASAEDMHELNNAGENFRCKPDAQKLKEEKIRISSAGIRLSDHSHNSYYQTVDDMINNHKYHSKDLRPWMNRDEACQHCSGFSSCTFAFRFSRSLAVPPGTVVLTYCKYFPDRPNLPMFKHRLVELLVDQGGNFSMRHNEDGLAPSYRGVFTFMCSTLGQYTPSGWNNRVPKKDDHVVSGPRTYNQRREDKITVECAYGSAQRQGLRNKNPELQRQIENKENEFSGVLEQNENKKMTAKELNEEVQSVLPSNEEVQNISLSNVDFDDVSHSNVSPSSISHSNFEPDIRTNREHKSDGDSMLETNSLGENIDSCPYGGSPLGNKMLSHGDADSSSDEEVQDSMDSRVYFQKIQSHRAFLSWEESDNLKKARGMCRLLLPYTFTIIKDKNQFILIYPAEASIEDMQELNRSGENFRCKLDAQKLKEEKIRISTEGMRLSGHHHQRYYQTVNDMIRAHKYHGKQLRPWMNRDEACRHCFGFAPCTFVFRFSTSRGIPPGIAVVTYCKYFPEKPNVPMFKHRLVTLLLEKPDDIFSMRHNEYGSSESSFKGIFTFTKAILGEYTPSGWDDRQLKNRDHTLTAPRTLDQKQDDLRVVQCAYNSVQQQNLKNRNPELQKEIMLKTQELESKNSVRTLRPL